jgi:hypothetical protein
MGTTSLVAGLPVMCIGLPNTGDVKCSGLNLRLGMNDRYKVKIGTWNIGSLTVRSRELAEVL